MPSLNLGRLLALFLALSACQSSAPPVGQGAAPVEFTAAQAYLSPLRGTTTLDAECDYAGDAEVLRTAQDTVRYCGRLNDTGVAALRTVLTPADRRLEIASAGGSLDAPLNVAFLVLESRLAVDVIGPCFSGCSSFVFVAGASRRVRENGIVAMHNTSSSASVIMRALVDGSGSRGAAPLYDRSQREHDLYQRAGVGFGLLYEPQNRIQTLCADINRVDARTREFVVDIASEFDLWLPRREQLEAYGVTTGGALPENLQDAVSRFRKQIGPAASTPKFVMIAGEIQRTPDLILRSVKRCAQ